MVVIICDIASYTVYIYGIYIYGRVFELDTKFDPQDEALKDRVLSSNFKLKLVI